MYVADCIGLVWFSGGGFISVLLRCNSWLKLIYIYIHLYIVPIYC